MSSANLGYGLNLVPAPSTPRLLYATSSQGLLKSTDGGATWIIVVADQFNPLVVDPTDATRSMACAIMRTWVGLCLQKHRWGLHLERFE